MTDKTKLIFIVDDDEMLSEMLADHLASLSNLKIEIFTTGEACLECLKGNPDLIILDFNLNSLEPKAANGIEILKVIKERNKNIRVVMHSSQSQIGEALELVEKSALEYIIKGQDAFYQISEIISKIDQPFNT